MSAVTMTRVMTSILLYVETCCVDAGGMLEGVRMNADDHAALKDLQKAGMLTHGRIPAKLLTTDFGSRKVSHWARLTDKGWEAAHEARRERAKQPGPFARSVFEEVDK